MPIVVGELGALVILLVCLALAVLMVKIMQAVADRIPSAGGILQPLKDAILGIGQGINTVLMYAVRGVEAAIGASWHALAYLFRASWQYLEHQALAYLSLTELVARLVYAHSGLRALVHSIEHGASSVYGRIRTLEREYHGIEARVRELGRSVAHGIGHDLRIGLRDVRREVAGIEHATVPALRGAIGYVEGEVSALGQFVKAIPGVSYLDWAKSLVLAGLVAVGLKGLTCDNNPLKNKDCSSNVWGDLESLLVGAAAFGVALNLVDIIDAAVKVEQEASGAIMGLVNIDGSVIHDAAVIVGAATNAVAT